MNKLIFTFLLLCGVAYAHEFSQHATYETCFTPQQNCIDVVTTFIASAKKQVLVQAYYLTELNIINELIIAKQRDIDVHVILDKSQVHNEYIYSLLRHNIDVKIDFKPHIAHNKVIIVDNKKILTGSFNFTTSAQFRNTENLIIIDDSKLAHEYVVNFFDRFNLSKQIINK